MKFDLSAMESGLDLKPFVDEDGLSSCPCFTLNQPSIYAEGHCWRVGCDDHPYDSRKSDGWCCVHVWGSQPDAARIRELLDAMDWYGGWALQIRADPRPSWSPRVPVEIPEEACE